MCDNIDEFEDDIWTRLDRKDALFILLIIEDDREHGQQEPIDFTDHEFG